LITDTDGDSAAVLINSSVTTVADVIAAINATDIGVEARINDAGTGILLYDTAGGTDTLKVEDLGSGTAAADLGLDANVTTIEIDDEPHKAINGAGTFSHSVAQSGLTALAAKINNLDAGVTASTIHDGTGYRLLLSVDKTGAANELLVDGAAAGLDFSELSSARDAVLEIGTLNGGTGLVVTSADNTFNDVVPGLELTVLAESTTNVRVDVTKAQTQLTGAIEDFVESFNSIQTNLDEVTAFDPEQLTTGILFGTSAALRVESDLNHLLSGRFFGVGQFTSLEAIGLSFTSDGKLQLNSAKLQEALDTDAAAVERLFTDETSGLAAKLKTTIEGLAGDDNSVLDSRAESLADIIKANNDRIKFMDERLTRERERMMLMFAQLESTIAAMQQNLTALAGLQVIPPLTSTRTA
jgi:flagellar hook-associated protein 2